MFFLISGFVIPFSILPDRAAPVGSFAIKRILRIYPAYWLSVPLAALVVFWIWGTQFTTREVLVNLTLMQDVFGVRSAEGVYWTLLVELVFYALCVVLLVSGSLFNTRRVAILAAALGLAFVVIAATVLAQAAVHDDERAVLVSQSLGHAVWRAFPQPLERDEARHRRRCAARSDGRLLCRRAARRRAARERTEEQRARDVRDRLPDLPRRHARRAHRNESDGLAGAHQLFDLSLPRDRIPRDRVVAAASTAGGLDVAHAAHRRLFGHRSCGDTRHREHRLPASSKSPESGSVIASPSAGSNAAAALRRREYDRRLLGGWWSGPLQVENTPAGVAGRGVRLRYIDALRGIAALLVLALHVANHYPR